MMMSKIIGLQNNFKQLGVSVLLIQSVVMDVIYELIHQ